MASTGNVFPTSGTSVDRAGSTAWTSPGNVTGDDGSNASAAVPTDYLVCSGFGFNIPAGATILGVTVRVEASETGSGNSNYVPQLISATTPTLIGSPKSAVTVNNTTPVISTNGGTSDTWGASLTPAIVNDAGFGVALWSTDSTNTLSIDFVTVAIEYAEPIGDDDDSGWWAGAQQCFAAVAIAGAAAALGTTAAIAQSFHQHNDELAVQLVPAVAAGAPPTQRLKHETRFVHWQQGDELPAQQAPAALDDGGWALQPLTQQVPQPLLLWPDDGLPVAATVLGVDEGGWWPSEARAVAPFVKVWHGDDERITAPAPLSVDIDYWLRLDRPYVDATYVVWATNEEIVPQPAQATSGGLPFFGQREEQRTKFVRWFHQDEVPIPPVFTPSEDHWQPPAVNAPAPVAVVWGHQDEIVPRFEDDSWQVPVVASVAPRAVVWGHQDEITHRRFEDDSWQVPVVSSVAPVALVWTHQDEITHRRFEDDSWQAPVVASVAPRAVVWGHQDESFTLPLRMFEEAWQRPIVSSVAPVAAVWGHQDDIATLAASLPNEDHWQPPIFRSPAPVALVWTQQDDISPAPRLSEDHYQSPPPTSDITVVLWGEDEPIVPRPRLSDDYWQPPAPLKPVAHLEVWRQQEEIVPRPRFDDDSWQTPRPAPVAPVLLSWGSEDAVPVQPAPRFDDDSWQTPRPAPVAPVLRSWGGEDALPAPPTPLTISEDYWPAPALLRLPAHLNVWMQQDESVLLPPPRFDDDAWQIPRSASVAPVLLSWVDEDALPVLTVSEDYWPTPILLESVAHVDVWAQQDEIAPLPCFDDDAWQVPQLTPAAPVLRSWGGDDEVPVPPTPLEINEDYPPVWVPPQPPAHLDIWMQQEEWIVPTLGGQSFVVDVIIPPHSRRTVAPDQGARVIISNRRK